MANLFPETIKKTNKDKEVIVSLFNGGKNGGSIVIIGRNKTDKTKAIKTA